MDEPSLLDYVKAKLMPWKYSISEDYLQSLEKVDEPQPFVLNTINESKKVENLNFLQFISRIKLFLALLIAIVGQTFLEPPIRNITVAVIFYGISILIVIWSVLKKDKFYDYENQLITVPPDIDISKKKLYLLSISLVFLIFAFFTFRQDQWNQIYFNFFNLSFWFLSFFFFLLALVDTSEFENFKDKLKSIISNKNVIIKLTPWVILLIISTILIIYFRFYRLNEVLGEMFSDHAEKLLDVHDVLSGKYPVFFVRNTGREFFQFYWTALIAIVLKTGVSFMSLKIGTALAGFLALPYIYLLGKELRNKWVGIIAFLFAGIAYWPNVISRVGLRFPFYPLFAAPTLFYLIRGIRQKRRNDFIYSGIALGLGLHGYSSTRFLPIVVVVALILFLIHKQSKGIRNQVINIFIPLVIASFIIFLPLFKFALVNPDAVSYRMMTRLTSSEQEIVESPVKIFVNNLWNAETMFFYSNGGTWVHSIPYRPALDIISAGLLFLGNLIVIIQYGKYRNWEDLFLLVAVPLLMMPSILSIAFPDENPSLNRTGGAIIPVFILLAIGLETVMRSLWRVANNKVSKLLVVLIAGMLFVLSSSNNFDLVFNKFDKQFMAGAWNTSQMGAVIKGFTESTGDADHAYVVPSPYWVDTRLVGINAGYPTKDYALWPDQFNELLFDDAEKLLILKPENQEALELLKEMFPNGILYNYDSGYEGKDFYIYHIPPLTIQSTN